MRRRTVLLWLFMTSVLFLFLQAIGPGVYCEREIKQRCRPLFGKKCHKFHGCIRKFLKLSNLPGQDFFKCFEDRIFEDIIGYCGITISTVCYPLSRKVINDSGKMPQPVVQKPFSKDSKLLVHDPFVKPYNERHIKSIENINFHGQSNPVLTGIKGRSMIKKDKNEKVGPGHRFQRLVTSSSSKHFNNKIKRYRISDNSSWAVYLTKHYPNETKIIIRI